MRVSVAGGAGAVGRRLVPPQVAIGHQVRSTLSADTWHDLRAMGPEPIVFDAVTNQLRTKGTENLIAAAEASGVKRSGVRS